MRDGLRAPLGPGARQSHAGLLLGNGGYFEANPERAVPEATYSHVEGAWPQRYRVTVWP